MKLSTNVFLAALSAVIHTQSASAADFRWYPAPNCVGSFSICFDLGPNQCCSPFTGPAASIRTVNSVTDFGPVVRVFGHAQELCRPSNFIGGNHNTCIQTSFAIFSAFWVQFLRRELNDNATLPSNVTEKSSCVDATGFGYLDEVTGEEVVFRIPDGKKEEVRVALQNDDVAALKVIAGGSEEVKV
ncbi:hypothetical protein FA15DRAFT_759174 [Coprinopsis marcescibilis]|uniref:Uncharacterized protein n=1 Tax=Coprinopsis marcescibilis TaxID=230819 RepID=A0A5C3KLB3_COPMA|nr:hypothetical protein FA15DRAFT_759174 [Coprinopsis marcescibilis]